MKAVLGALSSTPSIEEPPAKLASSTGKACVGGSVTPLPATSMPSAPLSWIELPRMLFRLPALIAVKTPALLLEATWFGTAPPTSVPCVPP